VQLLNRYFSLSAKMNETQRRYWQVHEESIVCIAVCQKVPLGLNSEKIKHVALAIVELRWSEGAGS